MTARPRAAAPAALLRDLRRHASAADARILRTFFKTGPGDYGEGDRFLGVRVPAIRGIVRARRGTATIESAAALLGSPWHEARLLGLLLLVDLFRRGDDAARERIYALYLASTGRINNWDLVDLSAGPIVGAWLLERNRRPLYRLVRSRLLWERRIAIIATSHFIARGDFGDTLRLAGQLLGDRHDLMHKAAGWMLREVGKRDVSALRGFLAAHAPRMPRTMLRYAIERLPEPERRRWLAVRPASSG